MLDYNINKNKLKTQVFEVSFDHEIMDAKVVNDVYIVLLEIKKGSLEVDNLYGISSVGKAKWRVQSVKEAFNIQNNTPYISLDVSEDGKVKVTNFYGMRYRVNPENGLLIEKECLTW
jgi:hypothetical protein